MNAQLPLTVSKPSEKTDDRFDWHADDCIVVRPQPAIAIYENPLGDIVIRQESVTFDPDAVILIRPENAPAVARALARLAAEIESA